jgi:hypothetical protein
VRRKKQQTIQLLQLEPEHLVVLPRESVPAELHRVVDFDSLETTVKTDV